MRKFFSICSVLLVCSIVLFTACDNDFVSEMPKPEKTDQLNSQSAKMQITAKIMAEISNNQTAIKEVKEGVERNLYYGLDEEFRFVEILQPQENKLTLRSANQSTIRGLLQEKINQEDNLSLRSSNGESGDIETFLIGSDIQVYWPYSENWDGEEVPVVAFDPGVENVDKITAYRSTLMEDGSYKIDSLIVDESYAMKHPVWVINQSDIPYEELPDFAQGEYIKDGVLFSGGLSQKNIDKTTDLVLRSATTSDIPVFQIGTLRVTKQHDDWFNGGSEFEFRNSQPLAPNYTSTGLTVIRKCISRKDIGRKKTFYLNEPLNTHWRVEQLHNALKVIETDGGGSRKWETNLSVKVIGKDLFALKAVIPYGSNDDHIYQKVLDRDYILSSGNLNYNGTPKTQSYRGVNWTMSIKYVKRY